MKLCQDGQVCGKKTLAPQIFHCSSPISSSLLSFFNSFYPWKKIEVLIISARSHQQLSRQLSSSGVAVATPSLALPKWDSVIGRPTNTTPIPFPIRIPWFVWEWYRRLMGVRGSHYWGSVEKSLTVGRLQILTMQIGMIRTWERCLNLRQIGGGFFGKTAANPSGLESESTLEGRN